MSTEDVDDLLENTDADPDYNLEEERYGTFTTGDGDQVVYDRDNPEAWLQSDYSVEVGGGNNRE